MPLAYGERNVFGVKSVSYTGIGALTSDVNKAVTCDECHMKCCDLETELLEDGMYRHKCKRAGCGDVYVSPAPRFRAVCRVQPAGLALKARDLNGKSGDGNTGTTRSKPSIARKVSSFTAAQARWLAAGSPVRSGQRIAEIFAVCQECDHFRAGAAEGHGTCRLCGCCLRRFGGLLNKIRMATEGCPAKPAKWEPDVVS